MDDAKEENYSILILDYRGNVIGTNKREEGHLIPRKKDIVGKNIREFETQPYITKLAENIEKTKSWNRVKYKSTHILNDGAKTRVEVKANPLAWNGGEAIAVFVREVGRDEQKNSDPLEDPERIKEFLEKLPGILFRGLNNEKRTMLSLTGRCDSLTGYEAGELIKDKRLTYSDLILNEDRERVAEEIRTGLKSEGSYDSTYRILTAGGKEKWVREQGRGVYDERGNLKFLEGFITDISLQKRLERNLKEYKMAVESSRDLIVAIDKEYRCLFANQSYRKFHGIEEERIEGKKLENVIGREEFEEIKPKLDRSMNGETVGHETERTHPQKGSRVLSISYQPMPREDEISGVMAVMRDITERKRREKKLEKLGERYEALYNRSFDGVYVHDLEGNIIDMNQPALETLGYSKDDLESLKIEDLLVEDQIPRAKRTLKKILKEGSQEENSVYKLKRKNGGHVWIETKRSLMYSEGEPYAVLGIARDITERKEAEERKGFLNTMLRQDIGSKCQALLGYLQLIENSNLSEEQADYLEKAQKVGREAEKLIKMAEELQKIEITDWTTEKDLTKMLNHIISKVSTLAEENEVDIKSEYPEKPRIIEVDYSLDTLLTILLETRIKKSDCSSIRISMEKMEEKILLKLEDDGQKLPKDVKNILSGEIYSGNSTGAGGARYYFIREIAEHNDARLSLEDVDQGEIRFNIHLPKP